MENFEPTIWGPHAWFFFETVVLSYPKIPNAKQKKAIKQFFMSLKELIPCKKCRDNYIKHIELNPLTNKILSNKVELVIWINTMHNLVENKNNLSIDEMYDYYNYIYYK